MGKQLFAFLNGGRFRTFDRFNCVATDATDAGDLAIGNVFPWFGEQTHRLPVGVRATRLQQRASGLAISYGWQV